MIRLVRKFENNCIRENSTIMYTLNRLEEARPKVLFLVDERNKLLASVTDGDVRRAIISRVGLDEDVSLIARHNPLCINDTDAFDIVSIAQDMMKEYDIKAVPVINKDGIITGAVINDSIIPDPKNVVSVPVVMMAGGKGTRLYPYTKVLPKPLIPIEDIPISERIMDTLHGYGCSDFHMIVNYKKNMIKSYFGECEKGYSIAFHDEDIPLGTGGGLKLIEEVVDGTFILTNCDILILEDISQILKHHKENGNKATMVCSLKNYEIPYGVVNFSDGGEIESFEEKPKMSFFTNTGYYILEKDVFSYIEKNENIGMPDILSRMRNAGLKVGVYPIGENAWLDMGQFDSMEGMERKLREINL